jgi:hypothetical protein
MSYLQRLTRRKVNSNWSAKNCRHATTLIAEGRMLPAGLAQVEAAKSDGRWDTAYAGSADMTIPQDFLDALEDSSPAIGAVVYLAGWRGGFAVVMVALAVIARIAAVIGYRGIAHAPNRPALPICRRPAGHLIQSAGENPLWRRGGRCDLPVRPVSYVALRMPMRIPGFAARENVPDRARCASAAFGSSAADPIDR